MTVVPHLYPTTAPDDARPIGRAVFLQPGEVVHWHYRLPGWSEGDSEFSTPMRVVRDDERGLVAWLASGTVHRTQRYADGGDVRSEPLERRWTSNRPRLQAIERWRGNGILRIAPTDQPWSVWLFWEPGDSEAGHPDEWAFAGWYVNLENAHVRCGTDTYTGDHILDLWIEPDGTTHLKDDDELDAATHQGRLTTEQAAKCARTRKPAQRHTSEATGPLTRSGRAGVRTRHGAFLSCPRMRAGSSI